MGYKFAIASGNWSNPLTWNDGVVPSSGDTVYSNSFTVVIDQNINVASLTNNVPLYYLQNQIIPLMKSNVSPSGLADAATNSSNAYLAFNGNKTDFWSSGIPHSGTLSYRFDTTKTIKRYSFTKANYYSPKNWTFEASNDGTNWTVLHTVANDLSVVRYTSGDIGNTTSYLYYRLKITAGIEGYEMRMYSFEMSEEAITNVFGTAGTGKFDVNGSIDIVFNGDGVVGNTVVLAINSNSPNVVNLSSINGGYILGPNQQVITADYTLLRTYGTCTLNYIGDVYSMSLNSYSRGGNFYVGGNNMVNIIGSVYASNTTDANGSFILNIVSSAPTVNITGNIYGAGGSVNNRAIQMSSANGILNVTGNITTQLGPAILMTAGILNHTGTVQVLNGNSRPAVMSTSTSILKFTSPFINYDGAVAVNTYKMNFYSGSTVQWLFQNSANIDFNLYSSNITGSTLGLPLTTDVRNGISFGTGGALTGSLIVPLDSNVRMGVPFDNTVGTADLTTEDIFNAIANSNNPIAVRLRNVATVQTTATTITSFNI